MSDTVACVSVSVWCLEFYLFILLWTWSIATWIRKKFGKKGRIRSWIFNLVGIGLNPVALSLSLWFLSSISAPAKLIRAGLNWYINTCLNPLALVLTHCVALVTLALSPFPFALHYSKASSLLTKLRIILLLLFFNQICIILLLFSFEIPR